jgi:hypothetical protein
VHILLCQPKLGTAQTGAGCRPPANAPNRGVALADSVLSFDSFETHERIHMNNEAGFRLSRLADHKKHVLRVRIGVMIVLCALPVAVALAKAGVTTLARVSVL